MPIAKVRLPDGRIARFSVPDGTTQDQVMSFAEKTLQQNEQPKTDYSAPVPNGTGAEMIPSHSTETVAIQPEEQNTDFASMSPIGKMVNAFRSDTGGPDAASVAVGAVKNAPKSAVEFGKNIVQPIIHPIDTFNGLKGVFRGLYSKATNGGSADEKTVDAIGRFYADRYGTVAKFKESMRDDPVGVLADMSAFLNASGSIAKLDGVLASNAGMKTAGTVLKKAGDAVEPLNIVKQSAAPAMKVVSDSVPDELYKSGAKFRTGKTFSVKDRDRAVRTALDNGFITKESTVYKIWDKIWENSQEVDGIIDGLASNGVDIPRGALLKEVGDLRKMVHPQGAARRRAITKLVTQLRKSLPEKISIDDVQALKRNIYSELENHYKNSVPKPALVNEFNEVVARAAMKELENIYPQLRDINKQSSEYIHLVKALEQSAKRVGNKNLISFDTIIKGMAGYQLGDIGGLVVGLATGIMDRDIVKQRVAIALRRLKREGARTVPAGKKNITYETGTLSRELNQQAASE